MDRTLVESWLAKLKAAWEGADPDGALALFAKTERYFERPFSPGTSQEDYRKYWQDIVGLSDIRFDYEVVAVDGNTACVHWRNWFRSPGDAQQSELDGMFMIIFNDGGECVEFRQWWFMRDS